MLNDPIPPMVDEADTDDWTPGQGLCRAAVWGAITAALYAALLAPVAWHAPVLLLNVWIRLVTGFFVTWTLFVVVHRTAGMTGMLCTLMVVVYALLALFSQNVVLALHGSPIGERGVSGWIWLEPNVVVLVNGMGLLGVGFAIALCHEGGAVWRTVVEILTSRITG